MANESKLENLKGVAKAFSYQFKITPAHKKLREKLDTIGNGFPKTKGGAETRVLAQLFTKEEAELAILFEDEFQTAEIIAKRAGMDTQKVRDMLETMALKGAIFSVKKGDVTTYRLVPFTVGILEFIEPTMDMPMGVNVGMMMNGGYTKVFYRDHTPYLRTIPITTDVTPDTSILPYDDIEEIINSRDRISVSPCTCRSVSANIGNQCKFPMDTCFQFNDWADFYVRNGISKYISKEEALALLSRNDDLGLINQVVNSRDPEILCSCCTCHCFVLESMRKFPGPAIATMSNYYCDWDESKCVHCGLCESRCGNFAIKMVDGKKTYDASRCIGCGLCVTKCPTQACVVLPKEEKFIPEETIHDTYKKMADLRLGRIEK